MSELGCGACYRINKQNMVSHIAGTKISTCAQKVVMSGKIRQGVDQVIKEKSTGYITISTNFVSVKPSVTPVH